MLPGDSLFTAHFVRERLASPEFIDFFLPTHNYFLLRTTRLNSLDPAPDTGFELGIVVSKGFLHLHLFFQHESLPDDEEKQ